MAYGLDKMTKRSADPACRPGAMQLSSSPDELACDGDVVLDLTGIGHVDASFLKRILSLSRGLESESRRVVIRNPEPEVARLLLLSGFFHLSDTIVLEHA